MIFKFIKQFWSNKSARKNDRKEPTADYSPSKAATSDNLSQEIVSRQVFISCLDKTMATDWSSISLNLFIETKLAAVQTLLQKEHLQSNCQRLTLTSTCSVIQAVQKQAVF